MVKIKNTDGQNFKSRMMILSDEVENQEKKKKNKDWPTITQLEME